MASLYEPKDISPEIVNQLIIPFTDSDIINLLRTLPNNKAPGINGITYEMLKHFPKDFIFLLTILFNKLLSGDDIPLSWSEALIYPIPKPEWWNGDLTKTHPITLLDTIRKVFVKLFNTRLNIIFSKHKLLQYNNIAGTQGSSTIEIILKINTIIEHCTTSKQKFYILLQDLSKAYDRVDLDLLELALKHFNLPLRFIKLILKLFYNQSNQIIMDNYLSESFDIEQGIIQGESISPLLWTIYYDPMFELINNSIHKGLTLTSSIPKHIDRPLDLDNLHSISIEFKLQGYLDDTTWIAASIIDLENNLSLAQQFYNFANIKINKSKLRLITNDKDLVKSKFIPIRYGSDTINTIVTPKNGGERILGVYFNAFNNN